MKRVTIVVSFDMPPPGGPGGRTFQGRPGPRAKLREGKQEQ